MWGTVLKRDLLGETREEDKIRSKEQLRQRYAGRVHPVLKIWSERETRGISDSECEILHCQVSGAGRSQYARGNGAFQRQRNEQQLPRQPGV